MFMRLMMHYKSWLPGVALARFGKTKVIAGYVHWGGHSFGLFF